MKCEKTQRRWHGSLHRSRTLDSPPNTRRSENVRVDGFAYTVITVIT